MPRVSNMQVRLRLVLGCGLIPITLGTVVFGAWLLTPLAMLELAGLYVIYGGVVLVIVGIIALLTYLAEARRAGLVNRTGVAVGAMILFLNFPVCAAYLALAFAMQTANVVTVENSSNEPVTDMQFVDPSGKIFPFRWVEPGQSRTGCFDFAGEGSVRYSLRMSGKDHHGVLTGYISDAWGSHATLLISQDGQIEASQSSKRVSVVDFIGSCAFE